MAAKKHNAPPSTSFTMSLAYGLLWHVVTSDTRVNAARTLLLSLLSNEMRACGIQTARERGAATSDREVLAVDFSSKHPPEPGLTPIEEALDQAAMFAMENSHKVALGFNYPAEWLKRRAQLAASLEAR